MTIPGTSLRVSEGIASAYPLRCNNPYINPVPPRFDNR